MPTTEISSICPLPPYLYKIKWTRFWGEIQPSCTLSGNEYHTIMSLWCNTTLIFSWRHLISMLWYAGMMSTTPPQRNRKKTKIHIFAQTWMLVHSTKLKEWLSVWGLHLLWKLDITSVGTLPPTCMRWNELSFVVKYSQSRASFCNES